MQPLWPALTVTSAASVVAYAESGPFDLNVEVGVTNITPTIYALKKEDNLHAIVTPTEGIPTGFYVDFQVREFDGSVASSVAYATQNNETYRMNYLYGHGERGRTYRLSATLEENPVVESADVSGRWTP